MSEVINPKESSGVREGSPTIYCKKRTIAFEIIFGDGGSHTVSCNSTKVKPLVLVFEENVYSVKSL